MKIAILGATSQIAKDLILFFANSTEHDMHLFARRIQEVDRWLDGKGLSERYSAQEFDEFPKYDFDAVINFVGVGNPAQAVEIGNEIFDITLQFDQMVIDYLKTNTKCRYIFLSSGAVYGSTFARPVTRDTPAVVNINALPSTEWYGVAKLYAESRHRAYPALKIVDVRVFNYFSSTQDLSSRFLMTDILRAIKEKTIMKTAADYIVRDYIHPLDFCQLIKCILNARPVNLAIDCYSKEPVDKAKLLQVMQEKFGLMYQLVSEEGINSTGVKPYYYSLNRRAGDFGYIPNYSSLDGIVEQAEAIVARTFTKENLKRGNS